LKEEKTLAQIASEYEVHLTQLKNWRAHEMRNELGKPIK